MIIINKFMKRKFNEFLLNLHDFLYEDKWFDIQHECYYTDFSSPCSVPNTQLKHNWF